MNIEKYNQLIPILSKLGLDYSVFVSTFCTTKDELRSTWKIPSLDEFVVALSKEWDKLV
jgi:hypothetical protein